MSKDEKVWAAVALALAVVIASLSAMLYIAPEQRRPPGGVIAYTFGVNMTIEKDTTTIEIVSSYEDISLDKIEVYIGFSRMLSMRLDEIYSNPSPNISFEDRDGNLRLSVGDVFVLNNTWLKDIAYEYGDGTVYFMAVYKDFTVMCIDLSEVLGPIFSVDVHVEENVTTLEVISVRKNLSLDAVSIWIVYDSAETFCGSLDRIYLNRSSDTISFEDRDGNLNLSVGDVFILNNTWLRNIASGSESVKFKAVYDWEEEVYVDLSDIIKK